MSPLCDISCDISLPQVRLSFLYCLYQRLLAGCVLIAPPHSILGNFTWKELCDVISEHVDQQTADLQKAKEEVRSSQNRVLLVLNRVVSSGYISHDTPCTGCM